MIAKDPRIDAYIAKAAGFAKPILNYIRRLVHEECPNATETVKWAMPHFEYKGALCGVAAFKQHCQFGFWKHRLVVGGARDGMGFGKFTSIAELPSEKDLRAYIRKAAQLNEDGIKAPSKPRPKQAKLLKAPAYFTAALKKNKKALATYEAFPPSRKNEYIAWVKEAKAEATRARRLAQALEWMAEGKARNWKYERC